MEKITVTIDNLSVLPIQIGDIKLQPKERKTLDNNEITSKMWHTIEGYKQMGKAYYYIDRQLVAEEVLQEPQLEIPEYISETEPEVQVTPIVTEENTENEDITEDDSNEEVKEEPKKTTTRKKKK